MPSVDVDVHLDVLIRVSFFSILPSACEFRLQEMMKFDASSAKVFHDWYYAGGYVHLSSAWRACPI